jgi:hypothetical protein
MRRKENEVCPSFLLTQSPIFLFPNTIVYRLLCLVLLVCLVRIWWLCWLDLTQHTLLQQLSVELVSLCAHANERGRH